MERFYFNIYDGHEDIDDTGILLQDLDAARLHALKTAGRVFDGETSIGPTTAEWKMEVTDAGYRPLFVLSFAEASVPWTLRDPDLGTDVDGPPDDPWSR